MNKLLIVDGHAMIHRAFHALPPLTSANGTPTNAVYGFFNMLYKGIQDFKPTHLAITFDTPTPTFRKELLEEYQSLRPELPEDLVIQFSIIKELLIADGIPCLEKPGFEADDVIGTIASKLGSKDTDVYILTGDKDILQMVNPHIHIIMPKIGLSNVIVYDREKVIEKMGVPPEQIPDYKALAGDSSDNYGGVKGLGPKTAIKLLQQFESVENMYLHIDQVEKEKLRDLLKEYKEKVLVLKTIATIRRDVDVEISLDKMKIQPYAHDFLIVLQKYQFNSLIKKYFPEEAAATVTAKISSVTKSDSQIDMF
jgi:DNA polymerase-1